MLSEGWRVYARTGSYGRAALLDEFSLECVERHLGLGTWRLEADVSSPNVEALIPQQNPGAGIQVVDPTGDVVFAGPVVAWEADEDDTGTGPLVVSGWDDMGALHARLTHPQPATAAPPFSTASHDKRTGKATTVLRQWINANVGPGALTARRWPGLALAADPAEGPTITVETRWQNLLEQVASVAAANGVTVLCRQLRSGEPQLEVVVRGVRDRSTSVELSPRAGTLGRWKRSWQAPSMTAGWVGGQGELTDRLVVQKAEAPPAEWPRRIERFVDYSNSEDTTQVSRKLDEELRAGRVKSRLELTPVEGPGAVYGVDFDLGDMVRVVIDQVETSVQVTSSTLRISADGVTRTVAVGEAVDVVALFGQLRRIEARLRQLESF